MTITIVVTVIFAAIMLLSEKLITESLAKSASQKEATARIRIENHGGQVREIGGCLVPPNKMSVAFTNATLDRAAVEDLANLDRLYLLILEDVAIATDAIEKVGKLQQVAEFFVTELRQPIDADLMGQIGQMNSLVSLDIRNTSVDDAGLRYLSQLSDLLRLTLSETGTTNEGLIHIRNLPSLDTLILEGEEITDESVRYLSGMQQHFLLDLNGTMISDDGVDRLCKTLPNGIIDKDGLHMPKSMQK